MWKKVRTKDINENQAIELIRLFENDFGKFSFVEVDAIVIELSKKQLSKYGNEGLRTLDSIQLATSVMLKSQVDLYKTTDKLLLKFFISEELPT